MGTWYYDSRIEKLEKALADENATVDSLKKVISYTIDSLKKRPNLSEINEAVWKERSKYYYGLKKSESKVVNQLHNKIIQSFNYIIDKINDESDEEWHDLEVEKPNIRGYNYYLVSGREEGDIAISEYHSTPQEWKNVDFEVMAWKELPMWYDWEKYQEEEPTEEELREQARDFWIDLKIDEMRGK